MVGAILCAALYTHHAMTHKTGYLTTSIEPMADAIKQNKKLYPVIKLMMKPITDAHNKIVIALIVLVKT